MDRNSNLRPALLGLCFLALALGSPTLSLAHDPGTIPNIVERVLPSVVSITVKKPKKATKGKKPNSGNAKSKSEEGFENQNASGFIIDASGIIVTNEHVVKNAVEITVQLLSEPKKLTANVVGQDAKTDIAVLKVKSASPLTPVTTGDSNALRLGEQILVVGSPFGMAGSVSTGIVSGKNRVINAGPYDRFIQTDAAMNKGSDGGPMFNLKGEVVGISTALISPSGGSNGVGFAVPWSLAKSVVGQLRQSGATQRGWLGVRIQVVTEEIAASLGLKRARGAFVNDVTPGSPAESAGVKKGDVIITWNGKDINTMRELPLAVAGTKVGSTVDVGIVRNGKSLTLPVTVWRLTSTQDSVPSSSGSTFNLGITLDLLTPAKSLEVWVK